MELWTGEVIEKLFVSIFGTINGHGIFFQEIKSGYSDARECVGGEGVDEEINSRMGWG